MKVAVFSTKNYDREFLVQANQHAQHELSFFEARLSSRTASLAKDHEVVCVFVNDQVDASVLAQLHQQHCRLVVLRSAGFNHVDLKAAEALGITVARVPAYSPHAVAEHALALVLALNRRIYRAYNRVREGNFSLDGLMGMDLHGKTAGIIGAGNIGTVFARILHSIGLQILVHDPFLHEDISGWAQPVDLDTLYQQSDLISLHCPLTPDTHHLINRQAIAQMKHGVMLINTSRGQIVDTRAVIEGLKSGQIGSLGLDVYEEEGDLFFADLSDQVIQDDVFMRLLTFPNVLITGHQGFFTREALGNIARTTINNITAFATGQGELFRVTAEKLAE
ncbi:MAG: 2-hydroxyacid dehydrogenase [Wenzhouxiangella sp.]